MNILVTGAAGFLGKRLVRALLDQSELQGPDGSPVPVTKITAFDLVPLTGISDAQVEVVTGDLRDACVIDRLITAETDSVFHLAAVVSGEAEANFDLGMEMNLDVTRALLERIRSLKAGSTRFVMMSSVAVFGGDLPSVVPDDHMWLPQSSYGTQKAMADLLIADYSRRGFVDGRSLRLPTIAVRAGKPNKAASSFVSSIIREPLNYEDAVCPVDPSTVLWIMSPQCAIRNMVHAHNLSATALKRRVINMPGLSVTVREMVEALRNTSGDTAVSRIHFIPQPEVERIVASWPGAFSADYARSLGFVANEDFRSVLLEYMEEINQAAETHQTACEG